MTFADYLLLLTALGLFVAFVVGRALLRAFWRAGKRMERHLERRLVDVVLVALGWKWLTGRRSRTERAPARPRPPVLEGDEIYRACPLSRWTGDPVACRWCNGVLPARAARWCRPACRMAAVANHEWGAARDAALTRDGHACRWTGCGAGATHEHALEVHHIRAIHGRHAEAGCHHHLDGLVTLCHPHHLVDTERQRAAGEFGPSPRRIGA